MSKHDSWVFLTSRSPFKHITAQFSEGFPVRDPFPMVLQQTQSGAVVPCWTFDLDRMSSSQVVYIASVFAELKNVELEGTIAQLRTEGAHLSYQWVERLECGPEGRARTAEIREFFAAHPDPRPNELLRFYEHQKQKWVEGDAKPAPELMLGDLTGWLQSKPSSAL
jgi:hypothetical protein